MRNEIDSTAISDFLLYCFYILIQSKEIEFRILKIVYSWTSFKQSASICS